LFRYFPTKEEIVFWSEYRPALAAFVSARPSDEPAIQALRHGIADGLTSFYGQDREQLLERLRLAFRTPALQPRMRKQQAHWAAELAEILASRLGALPDDLEIRAIAAAIAAAVWVAAEHWQAQDGRDALGALIERALDTVLAGFSKATATAPQ
jgi:AcrR family transcriptional regulator